ncbi:NFYB/HAP3 family transcription factor subunit, partial [Candidatus Woesearchaeota archaeon]|nr:NFYB/HAP3 family transcription factor subunit [Candidatus Woesearchaeota archaeon]
LKNALEEIAYDIAVKSIKLAEHAGRKTVKPEDIKLAVKE